MKLVYIANLRLPTEKAHGIQIAKTCEALGKIVDLTLVYPNRSTQDLFEYYGIKRTFKTLVVKAPDFYWGILDKVAFLIKSFIAGLILVLEAPKADIYYTRDEFVAFLLSFKSNVVFECHRFSPKKKFFYSRIKNLKAVAISDVLKKDLLCYGFRNVIVARDGVDLEMFKTSDTKDNLILYTGRTWKGDKIPENLTWIKYESYKDIPKWLNQAKILILPNNNRDPYTSPMKMFEYMASGRPIVASNIPAIREVLNENNAVLVSPDKIDEGIQRLLDDPELGERLAKQARLDVEQFTWDKRASRILEFMRRKQN